ncbi:hypothetical protein SAMN05216436_12152 [bacterium A37T11]|nr:hypothetical protein SAMN05216436_12152 [bacterium A37T11]
MPAGFWNNFQKKFLIKTVNDQGTNGGHIAMYWKTEKPGFFNSKEVIAFAVKNGWELKDSLDIQLDNLKTWRYNNVPIFPLSYTGFSIVPKIRDSEYENFPRWIHANLKIYEFTTGWLTYDPGTDNSFEINGFVVVNTEENEMSVYHLWGE